MLLADRLVLALHMAQEGPQDVRQRHQFGQVLGPAPEPAALRGKGVVLQNQLRTGFCANPGLLGACEDDYVPEN